jgi:hypothetical protein
MMILDYKPLAGGVAALAECPASSACGAPELYQSSAAVKITFFMAQNARLLPRKIYPTILTCALRVT